MSFKMLPENFMAYPEKKVLPCGLKYVTKKLSVQLRCMMDIVSLL